MSPAKRVSARARAAAPLARPQAGGSRKKTGCYTCRIRRKKCDETRDSPRGGCDTCHRLRLECLGYGDKRPTWLRDRQFLDDTLEKIKKHLTKNGLLRGQHSARASNTCLSNEAVTGSILILNPQVGPIGAYDEHESTSDPSSPTSSLSSPEAQFLSLNTSSIRDEPHEPEFVPNAFYNPKSAIDVPLLSTDFANTAQYAYANPAYASQFMPGYSSTFGPSYNLQETIYSPELEYASPTYDDPTQGLWSIAFAPPPQQQPQQQQPPFFPMADYFFRPNPFEHESLNQYFHYVAKKQFLLADQRVLGVIYDALLKSSPAHQAASLLTQLHQYTAQGSHAPPQLAQHVENQAATIMAASSADQGSALAALQLVSCLLHVGGRGPWQDYLDHAVDWVITSVGSSPYPPAVHVRRQPADAQFVIRTAMWFDVLGAITRAKPPRLLSIFRELHTSAVVTGVDDGEEESMLPIMGCEDAIVRALGETSALAHWAEMQRAQGCLSTVDLVQRGLDIEHQYLGPPTPAATTPRGGSPPSSAATMDPVTTQRAHTSAVFRASAKLYLHTVLSGELPACAEIRAAVTETVDALRNVPADGDAERSIVRMTVFAICLAGCMSDNPDERAFLEERLERQQAERMGGNCAEVLRVMREVWAARAAGESLGWRAAVGRSPQGMLLLV